MTDQHVRIGEATHYRNKHGADVEHQAWEPSRMVEGRCCGRKPIQYKRLGPPNFCLKCNRAYDVSGEQIPNWAFKRTAIGFERDTVIPW